jgi:hypothetical protein
MVGKGGWQVAMEAWGGGGGMMGRRLLLGSAVYDNLLQHECS